MDNKELMEKAKRAHSPEELIALAKENEIELSEESAKAYYEQINKSGELSDDELDNVAGGGCHGSGGRLIVTVCNSCNGFKCSKCGKTETRSSFMQPADHHCLGNPTNYVNSATCNRCAHCSYEKGIWYCNNPINRK